MGVGWGGKPRGIPTRKCQIVEGRDRQIQLSERYLQIHFPSQALMSECSSCIPHLYTPRERKKTTRLLHSMKALGLLFGSEKKTDAEKLKSLSLVFEGSQWMMSVHTSTNFAPGEKSSAAICVITIVGVLI